MTVNPSLAKHVYKAVDTEISQPAFNEAMKSRIGDWMLGGLAAGGAAAGAVGLFNLFRRASTSAQPAMSSPVQLKIPVTKVDDDEDEDGERAAPPRRLKAATVSGRLGDFFSGADATSFAGHPLFIPAVGLGSAATFYGGYKLINALVNAMKKKEMAQEKEEAQRRFEAALRRETEAGAAIKTASSDNDPFVESLDRFTDVVFKQGSSLQDMAEDLLFNDTTGKLTGAAILGGVGLTALSAMLANEYFSKRRQHSVLAKAEKQRRRIQQATRPQWIFARPVAAAAAEAAQEEEAKAATPPTAAELAVVGPDKNSPESLLTA